MSTTPLPPYRRYRTLIASLLTLSLVCASAQAGQIHALVIGIDAYRAQGGELSDLQGAVNDARDIAAALEEIGAAQVQVLLDEDAHRDAIFTHWQRLKANAQPGDTLLLTYAGHGAQEPERTPGSESDDMDEVTVLGGFRTSAPHNYQRIVDYEWRDLVTQAQDYNVILVFDACHSGTMNRSLGRGRSRFGLYGAIEHDQLPLPPPITDTRPAVLAHEVYIGATRDDMVVHEILIDGQHRGALSYTFARALRGAADTNGDGVVSRGELSRFIDTYVRQLAEHTQYPSVLFVGSPEAPLLPVQQSCPTHAQSSVRPQIPVAIDALPLAEQASLLARLSHIQAAAAAQAELIWNPQQGAVHSQHGDQVASLPSDPQTAIPALQNVIDKWRTLPALYTLTECRQALQLSFLEGSGLHRAGHEVNLVIAPRTEPYLTLINLPSTGLTQWLYPRTEYGDVAYTAPQQPFTLNFVVTPPFGGDHLIALASRHPPQALHQALAQLEGRASAPQVFAELQRLLRSEPGQHELGILSFYTAP